MGNSHIADEMFGMGFTKSEINTYLNQRANAEADARLEADDFSTNDGDEDEE